MDSMKYFTLDNSTAKRADIFQYRIINTPKFNRISVIADEPTICQKHDFLKLLNRPMRGDIPWSQTQKNNVANIGNNHIGRKHQKLGWAWLGLIEKLSYLWPGNNWVITTWANPLFLQQL